MVADSIVISSTSLKRSKTFFLSKPSFLSKMPSCYLCQKSGHRRDRCPFLFRDRAALCDGTFTPDVEHRLREWVRRRNPRTEREGDARARACLALWDSITGEEWHRFYNARTSGAAVGARAAAVLEATGIARRTAGGWARGAEGIRRALAAAESSDDSDSSDDDSSDDGRRGGGGRLAVAAPAPAGRAEELLARAIELVVRANPEAFAGQTTLNITIDIRRIVGAPAPARVVPARGGGGGSAAAAADEDPL